MVRLTKVKPREAKQIQQGAGKNPNVQKKKKTARTWKNKAKAQMLRGNIAKGWNT